MASGQGILNINIKDKPALYAAYMPFVKNGGLFIPTPKKFKLGGEVFMLLTVMDDKDRMPIAGKIIWITPQGAQGNKAQGIGVQFSKQDNGATRNKIEGFLAGALQADKSTHTM